MHKQAWTVFLVERQRAAPQRLRKASRRAQKTKTTGANMALPMYSGSQAGFSANQHHLPGCHVDFNFASWGKPVMKVCSRQTGSPNTAAVAHLKQAPVLWLCSVLG